MTKIERAKNWRSNFQHFPLDMPIRLRDAAALAFPPGSMTISGLRREAARGNLTIERIAGKDFTTLGHINRMRELCRVEAKVPISGSAEKGGTDQGSSSEMPLGSSSITINKKAQDAL